jgi:hypothetical protein
MGECSWSEFLGRMKSARVSLSSGVSLVLVVVPSVAVAKERVSRESVDEEMEEERRGQRENRVRVLVEQTKRLTRMRVMVEAGRGRQLAVGSRRRCFVLNRKQCDMDNEDALVCSNDPCHPANLIPELCSLFYRLGWVTGTGFVL